MNIAILGISGNPVHLGHLKVAEAVAQIVDEVWLMPCWNHMFNKTLASSEDRLEMCKLAVKNQDKIKVSSFEIDNKLTGGTYDTLIALKNTFNHNFLFIIGQDNADTISKWRNYSKLISEFTFIIVPRKGYKPSTTWYDSPRHIYLKDFEGISISSTEIRKELLSNSPLVKQYVCPEVLAYIANRGLYQK